MNQGLLIVIEGIDGSGKSTQIELLKQYLASKGTPCEAISFPRYGENTYADLISWYLNGQFGRVGEVSPYFVALAYAGDRVLARPLIEKWLSEGKIVLVNRYISSSKAHLGGSLTEDKREEFIRWLDELEYSTNRMPKEALTILLKVDPKAGQKNLSERFSDMHEENLRHLEDASQAYLNLTEQNNWYTVECMKEGQMMLPEDIHQEIVRSIEKALSISLLPTTIVSSV